MLIINEEALGKTWLSQLYNNTCHDITEILLKLALSTNQSINQYNNTIDGIQDSITIIYNVIRYGENLSCANPLSRNLPGTSKTGFGQVKIKKEFVWINRKFF